MDDISAEEIAAHQRMQAATRTRNPRRRHRSRPEPDNPMMSAWTRREIHPLCDCGRCTVRIDVDRPGGDLHFTKPTQMTPDGRRIVVCPEEQCAASPDPGKPAQYVIRQAALVAAIRHRQWRLIKTGPRTSGGRRPFIVLEIPARELA